MAKTNFQNGDPSQGVLGTPVVAAFLNAIFNHRHDGQNQDGSAPLDFAADTGVANAYAAAYSPAIAALADGMVVGFRALHANNGPSTFAPDAIAAAPILTLNHLALKGAEIAAGSMVFLTWNATLNSWLLVWASGLGAPSGNSYQARNRLINGAFEIDVRNNGVSTAIANDHYCVDRWYALTQTASVLVDQVIMSENGQPKNIRLTQNQATPQRMGIAQIVEAAMSWPDRGQSITFSARVRTSIAQAVRYAILAWTGTPDSVVSNVVNTWASNNYSPGNFFLPANLAVIAIGSITPVVNTWTDLSPISGSAPSGLNNYIVMVWTEGTMAQNGTLEVGRAQLELGGSATAFERRDPELELVRCQIFCRKIIRSNIMGVTDAYGSELLCGMEITPPMRSVPGVTLLSPPGYLYAAASAALYTSYSIGFLTANGFQIVFPGTLPAANAGGTLDTSLAFLIDSEL